MSPLNHLVQYVPPRSWSIKMDGKDMRCSVCGHLLCKAVLKAGSKLEFKCSRCKQLVRFAHL